MKPFNPAKPKSRAAQIWSLAIPARMHEDLLELSKRTKIPKQELIRQMIEHCLLNIVFEPTSKKEKQNEAEF